MVLHRLSTGLFYSQPFADYLLQRHAAEHQEHPGEILQLDYVRCGQGELAGQAWWQLTWITGLRAPSDLRHTLGEVEVYIHRQALRGLKDRLLHFDGTQVVVKK